MAADALEAVGFDSESVDASEEELDEMLEEAEQRFQEDIGQYVSEAVVTGDLVEAARKAYHAQTEGVAGQGLIQRFGDNMQGVVYAGVVLILGGVMVVEAGDVVNYTEVDSIVSNLIDIFTTSSSLLILIVLAIIFGYALFYLQMSGGRNGRGGSRSRT